MAVYFLDPAGLSYIIAPELNREFGLLEHIQSLIILAIIFIAFRKSRSSMVKLERFFFLGVGLFSLLIFLEELDYGIHYYEYLQTGTIAENSTGQFEKGTRNLHNIRDTNDEESIRKLTMVLVYTGFVFILGVFALLKNRLLKGNALAQWIIPSSGYFAMSLTAMLLLNELTLYLDQNVKDPSITALNGNTIEFQETFIYYIALLYIWELSRKPFPFAGKTANTTALSI